MNYYYCNFHIPGNGPALSLKAFRTLTKRFFWNGGAILQFTPQGIRPGLMSSKYLFFLLFAKTKIIICFSFSNAN